MGVEGEVELELNLAHNWHTGQPKTPGKVQFSTDSQSVDLRIQLAFRAYEFSDIDAKRKKQAACVGRLHTTSAVDSLLLAVRGPGDEISYCFRL